MAKQYEKCICGDTKLDHPKKGACKVTWKQGTESCDCRKFIPKNTQHSEWEKEFDKQYGTIYHKEPEGFGIRINDDIKQFISQLLQSAREEGYKEGWNSGWEINGKGAVKAAKKEAREEVRKALMHTKAWTSYGAETRRQIDQLFTKLEQDK